MTLIVANARAWMFAVRAILIARVVLRIVQVIL